MERFDTYCARRLAPSRRGNIFVDGVVHSFVKRDHMIALLRQHIFCTVLFHRNRYYRLREGIPQVRFYRKFLSNIQCRNGEICTLRNKHMFTLEPDSDTHTEFHPPLQLKGSLISTILCNVYYGHVERTVFPDILRVVDRDREDWARAAAAAAATTVVAEAAAAVVGRSGSSNCGGRGQGEEGGEGEEGKEGEEGEEVVGRVDVSGHHNLSSSSSSTSSSSTSFSASSSSLSSLFTGGATGVGNASEDEVPDVPDAALARLTDDFLLLTTDRTIFPASLF